jgi:hypothetical protein
MDLTKFYTRERAAAGAKLYLVDPTTGKKTKEWLLVLGADADAVRLRSIEQERANSDLYAEQVASGLSDEKAKAALEKILRDRLLDSFAEDAAALVIGWSDAAPFDPEAIKTLCRQAAQIANQITSFSRNRAAFFGGEESNSSSTQKPTSDSVGP